jgi:hypothetical protein
MSSSENLSPKAFILSLPVSSFRPSLICLAACSSVKPLLVFGVRHAFTWAILPAFVCPAPSGPWQAAQFFVQLSLASARSGRGRRRR